MKAKILSILMTACLVFSMTACGTNEKEEDTQTEINVDVSTNESEKEEVKEDTGKEDVSKEISEELSEATAEAIRSYLPDTLEFPDDKAIDFVTKSGDDSISLTITMTCIPDEANDKEYYSMNMSGIKFFAYKEGNDQYFMIDDEEMYLDMYLGEVFENNKSELAQELGVSEDKVTKELVESYVKENFAPATGYVNVTDSEENESFEELQSEIGFSDIKDNALLEGYDKNTCEIVDYNKNEIVVAYDAVFEEVKTKAVATLNRNTNEIFYLEISVNEEGVTTDVTLKFSEYDWNNIDLSWITKDGESTTEDVLTRFMGDIFIYAFSLAGLESVEFDATLN